MASYPQYPGSAYPPYFPPGQMPQPSQVPSPLPPWRQQIPNHTQTRLSKRSGKVDSWRSYQTDSTNLQSATGAQPQSTLNASAPAFQPPSYRPYEPLRVSDGTAERTSIAGATGPSPTDGSNQYPLRQKKKKQTQLTIPAVMPSTEFASRYPVRSNCGQADLPIPSIEINYDTQTKPFRKGTQAFHTSRHITPRKTGSPVPRATKSPEAPEATSKYMANARKEPVTTAEAKKLLVVLDLNGTLLYRTKRGPGNYKVHMRPGVTPFLDYLFDNHVVMVYTSTMPANAQSVVEQFLHPKHRNRLAALWARDKLDLNKTQFYNKVQVYKKLDKLWQDKAIQQTAGPGRHWDQSNTVLIDDSKLKALAQPHNLLQVPEYTSLDDPAKEKDKEKYQHAYKIQQDIIKQLELKLEVLKYQANLSRMIRKWQTGEIDVPRVDGQEVVVEETIDQKTVPQETNVKLETHLPTPDSTGPGEESSDEVDGGVRYDSELEGDREREKREDTVSSIGEEVFKELLSGGKKS